MIREIEVEGVGTLRPCNDWQIARIKHMHDKDNARIAWMAFGLGMTIKPFRKLPSHRRVAVWEAYKRLTSAANTSAIDRRAAVQGIQTVARVSEAAQGRETLSGRHLRQEEKIALGRQLIEAKARLPHGHFGPWLIEQGISSDRAHRCMRLARGRMGDNDANRMAA